MAVSKMFLKLIIFFLTLPKKSVVISFIFKIENYCHIPIQLMLAKYDTSFLRRTKKCTVISIMTPSRNSPRYIQDKSVKFYDNLKKHVFLLVVSLWELFLCPDWDRVAIRILK